MTVCLREYCGVVVQIKAGCRAETMRGFIDWYMVLLAGLQMVLRSASGIDVARGMVARNNSRSEMPTGSALTGLSKSSHFALLFSAVRLDNTDERARISRSPAT